MLGRPYRHAGRPYNHPPPRRPQAGSIGAIIGQFKSITAKRINARPDTPGAPLWQRNDYEHLIRDAASLQRIREYIAANPQPWALDGESPASPATGDAAQSQGRVQNPPRPSPRCGKPVHLAHTARRGWGWRRGSIPPGMSKWLYNTHKIEFLYT